MPAFYSASVQDFLEQSATEVLAALGTAYAHEGFTRMFTDQTLTWERDLASLRDALIECVEGRPAARNWQIVLEFSVPRKEVRIDALILVGDVIVLLEAKSGEAGGEARRQLEEYALLLHYFHKGSDQKRIVPLLISRVGGTLDTVALAQPGLFPQLASHWIAPVQSLAWSALAEALLFVAGEDDQQLLAREWVASAYHPVPSILQAAVDLRKGLKVRDIALSEASEHELETVRATLQRVVDEAREKKEFAICFVTGVPGSGKTLVGLGIAHDERNVQEPVHFMSGNGPLVKVLQHLFTQERRKEGASAPEAKIHARTLVENVHIFARHYADETEAAPSNHALIFDEAQRAWNRDQNFKKFKRDYSEPEMLLRIMERHEDWAVVIALVGGGQEINDGEAGLEEWGHALSEAKKPWAIYASPEVLAGGASTAGHALFAEGVKPLPVHALDALHLRTSNRSLRAEKLAQWVNHVLRGEAEEAAALRITQRFPIFLSRDLAQTRAKLRAEALGDNRYGLVGSSGAARLRAEGLEPSSSFHASYAWEHWYLGAKSDVRSSFQCEVFATEFEIQGLELDWIGLCWGGDLSWTQAGWQPRNLWPGARNRWNVMKSATQREFRQNAYRVLLTRARQGMVIFVPQGSAEDPTTSPREFDLTAEFLVRCGVQLLP